MFSLLAFVLLTTALLLHPAVLLAAVSSALMFGAVTYSVGIQTKTPEGTIANTTDSFTGNAFSGVDAIVPATTVDQAEACAVIVANLIMCVVFSPLAVTLKTYEAGVLKQTIDLPAGKQLVWDENSTFANPFTDNFDTIKISNADASKSTQVKGRFLMSN